MSASDLTGSFSSFTKAFRLFLLSALLAHGAWLALLSQMTPVAMIAGPILLERALTAIDGAVRQWQIAQRGRRLW